MKIISYILTILGTLIGGFTLFDTMLMAESAPQQGAGAALALAWAVLPYCFARAVEKIGEVTVFDAFKRHWRREEEKANTATPPAQTTEPKFNPLTGQRLVR